MCSYAPASEHTFPNTLSHLFLRMKSSSEGGEFSGLYRRGKQFWFRYRHNGHQYRVFPGTDDATEALLRALAIRADPVISGANTFRREVQAYIQYQLESKRFSRNSAENREAVLLAAVDAIGKRDRGGSHKLFERVSASLEIDSVARLRRWMPCRERKTMWLPWNGFNPWDHRDGNRKHWKRCGHLPLP